MFLRRLLSLYSVQYLLKRLSSLLCCDVSLNFFDYGIIYMKIFLFGFLLLTVASVSMDFFKYSTRCNAHNLSHISGYYQERNRESPSPSLRFSSLIYECTPVGSSWGWFKINSPPCSSRAAVATDTARERERERDLSLAWKRKRKTQAKRGGGRGSPLAFPPPSSSLLALLARGENAMRIP